MLPCAWGAAAERARVGTLCLEDAHHLFEELLKQDNLLNVTVLEGRCFLATHPVRWTPPPAETLAPKPWPSSAGGSAEAVGPTSPRRPRAHRSQG